MPKIPDGAKTPSDRKKKAEPPAERFTFEHDGETYTFAPTLDHLTPGFIRRNRSSEVEFTYSLLEALADDKTLAVIDGMTFKENRTIMRDFDAYVERVVEVNLGE